MYPYDALSWYELDLDREAEARDNGFDTWEDYQMSKSDDSYEKLVNEERLFNPYAR